MTDAFDALRDADAQRQEWIRAARVFTRLLDRVVDPAGVLWLERLWAEESAKPLAPASKAWELVEWAKDAVSEDMPLTFEEMRQHNDLTVGDVIDETRKWMDARTRRNDEVEREVERLFSQVTEKRKED